MVSYWVLLLFCNRHTMALCNEESIRLCRWKKVRVRCKSSPPFFCTTHRISCGARIIAAFTLFLHWLRCVSCGKTETSLTKEYRYISTVQRKTGVDWLDVSVCLSYCGNVWNKCMKVGTSVWSIDNTISRVHRLVTHSDLHPICYCRRNVAILLFLSNNLRADDIHD